MPSIYYIPKEEFHRIQSMDCSIFEKSKIFAEMCRINTLYMITNAGSGHIGSSFSSMDIVTWLFCNEMRTQDSSENYFQDIFFSSKGHDVPGLYSVLIGLGLLPFDMINKLRIIDGLPGHPDISTPHIVANTGSLGMGISKAKGMVLANRLKGKESKVFVLTGDGELQEGQIWESLFSASNLQMDEITVIVDNNKIQSDMSVAQTCSLGDLESKFHSFGWHVLRCDGHEMKDIASAIKETNSTSGQPHVIIADTVKGKGVSFMDYTQKLDEKVMYPYHSGAPDKEVYIKSFNEILGHVNSLLKDLNMQELVVDKVKIPNKEISPSSFQNLISAYSKSIVFQASKNKEIVALDADLKKDCGLLEFEKEYPDRFFECGISEQDMVSQAGGFALRGFLPIVHSFACFLSSRPNEQIYNNATEKNKIIYVGSLAGLLPAGPGHSHQSVRDIASLSSIPDLMLTEPCNEQEVSMMVDYCINSSPKSAYIRLESISYNIPYELPSSYKLEYGKGVALTEGSDAILFGYGPALLIEAFRASEVLKLQYGIGLKVINFPWLNHISSSWICDIIKDFKIICTMDNHYIDGGVNKMFLSQLGMMNLKRDIEILSFGIDRIPVCGKNDEALKAHGLTSDQLVERIKRAHN